MIGAGSIGRGRELRLLGILYLFLSELVEMAGPGRETTDKPNRREEYVKKALDYFRMNYARPVGVSEAAAHVGLDRSYFSEIFRDVAGQPPRDFLMRLRMEKACQFLRNPGLSIGDTARSVGYDDPLLFSKVFRKHFGASPSAFRKSSFPASGSPSSD
jgi:AraC-like DNA-binding protein